MGKKVKRKTYVSKGQRDSVSRSTVKAVRRDVSAFDREIHKVNAWIAGKNPWITIANPSKETNRKFIKVRANAEWGDPKRRFANLYGVKDEQ